MLTLPQSLEAAVTQSAYAMLLHSNSTAFIKSNLPPEYITFEALLALGNADTQCITTFDELAHLPNGNWWFGHIGHNAADDIQYLKNHPPFVDFDPIFFFVPDQLYGLKGGEWVTLFSNKPIQTSNIAIESKVSNGKPQPIQEPKYELYINKYNEIKAHIQSGEYYEINYCLNWQYCNVKIADPFSKWKELVSSNPSPFACFYKKNNVYLLGNSPERFLKHKNGTLIAQPIKGTVARKPTPEADQAAANALKNDLKERAENVMIVDLMRNDLTPYAVPESVTVPSLFEVFALPKVHQMISTVTAQLKTKSDALKALLFAFPVGSMTGAPKSSVMKHLPALENNSRGIYAGITGYITPEQDFDFSVVIRSIAYDATLQRASIHAGSAITWESVAEKEWEECLLKAHHMLAALDLT